MAVDFDTFILEFKGALASNQTMVFFCNCKIDYNGSAASYLPQGDRMIVIKSDNSLIVHQPEGYAPVNYIKEGSQISVSKEGRHINISSHNLKYKESLSIEIWGVYSFMSSRLDDGQKIILKGNDNDMSDMIYDNPGLISSEFKPFSKEEHVKYSFLDLFGENIQGDILVVECKRHTADLACVTQLRTHVEKMKELKGVENIFGIIAAPQIAPDAKIILEDWKFTFKKVNPPKRVEKQDKTQMNLANF